MKPTQQLHDLGQSLWLDNITRGLLRSGTLRHYIDDLSVTGLTSNPSIFDLAIKDLRQAADLFRPVHDATVGLDCWVSLEVSPSLAYDSASTVKEAVRLHAQAQRPNLFIKIPGTKEGQVAIEEAVFRGVPVNVTLLFSAAQYVAAAEAYLRGIERRIAARLDPKVHSVASMFISRWDKAVMGKVPKELQDRLGIAIAKRTYKAYREMLAAPRWQKAASSGAPRQRLLWASTGTQDPKASDVLYIKALAAPDTINTIPEKTLLAFADHGALGEVLSEDGGDAESVIAMFAKAGVDDEKLAAELQREGAASFVASWKDLLNCIESKVAALKAAG
jgi:transaldolase